MNYTVTSESLSQVEQYRQNSAIKIRWEPLFLLPTWLQVWQECFAPAETTQILVIREDDQIIGIAPLLLKINTASIIGSENVCDYFDFPIMPGKENIFFIVLLDYLKNQGIKVLDNHVTRPDSTIMTNLVEVAKQLGWRITVSPDELAPEVALPDTWEKYLESLDTKQRHELRRKLRRLEAAGTISSTFIISPETVPGFLGIFLKMFIESREDKADFLTPEMETYFESIILKMAEMGILRAFILELDKKPVAALVAFDYNDVIYLYNSGFERDYSYLSVGILSKALLIKDGIERGKIKFDFLKGSEPYKFHLGGKEVRLQKCRIDIG